MDEGRYLCSARTMYRVLAQNRKVHERRRQAAHPNYKRPELLATAPNQTWSWDVTLLRGPTRGVYYYFFVLLDIFVTPTSSAGPWPTSRPARSPRLIRQSCRKPRPS